MLATSGTEPGMATTQERRMQLTQREKRFASDAIRHAWEGIAHDAGNMYPEDRWDAIHETVREQLERSRKKSKGAGLTYDVSLARVFHVLTTRYTDDKDAFLLAEKLAVQILEEFG
jgi:hypothetical protein